MVVDLVCGEWENILFEAVSVLIQIHTTQQDYNRVQNHCKAKSFTSKTTICTQTTPATFWSIRIRTFPNNYTTTQLSLPEAMLF